MPKLRQLLVDALVDMDVVVAVNAHDFLHNVALARDVHFAGRDEEFHALGGLGDNLDVERGEGGADGIERDALADEPEDTVEVDVHLGTGDGGGVEVHHLGSDGGTGQLLDEMHGTLQRPAGDVGVAATLVAEGGVGLQAVAFASLADAHGVEIGTLEEDAGGVVGHAALLATEHTGDAHAFLLVANHQVAAVQLPFHSVEGDEGGVLRQGAHHHVVARDFVGIESVQRLSYFHEDEIGHIDHIVDGTNAHGAQLVLQPLGRLGHVDVLEGDAGVAWAELRLLDGNADAVLS